MNSTSERSRTSASIRAVSIRVGPSGLVHRPRAQSGPSGPRPPSARATLTFSLRSRSRPRNAGEIYGGIDADHLPSSGTLYEMKVTQGAGQSYPFVEQWDRDEGATTCFADSIAESHSQTEQHVFWSINLQ